MKIFLATSYSPKVDYATGKVFPDYRAWLEELLERLDNYGHEVFSALKADDWRINDLDPALAFKLDESQIADCDAMLAIVTEQVSAGVQMEIGMAIGQKKQIVIAHEKQVKMAYFNKAVVSLGQAKEITLPIVSDPFELS